MSTWHADADLLARYVRGEAGPLLGASVEQHLLACPDCRARIAAHVETPLLESVWTRIQEQAQADRRSLVERVLVRLGVAESDALLVARAPSLRTSWLIGLAVSLVFIGVGAEYGGTRGLAFFLLVAPLVPVAGVAFAYGPDVDPAYEAGLAVPHPAARLLLLRTAAVLATSLPLGLLTTFLVPNLPWTATLWLLPASALTASVLAASTWIRPTVAAAGLGGAWVCAVVVATRAGDPTALLGPVLLIAYVVLGSVAVLVLYRRLPHLARLGRSS
jgi:hypothetical protein